MKLLLYALFCFVALTGCSDKGTTPEVPIRYEGHLNLVVYENGIPAENIPVVLSVANQVDPGPISYDTVFTNQYGVAFDSLRVICGTYEAHGELVAHIGEFETRTIHYNDGDIIKVLSWN